MRFRQIHLDFHTSEHIPGIGAAFDKAAWQKTLRDAAVDSITCFSACHHGWSYHPTKIGKMHPNLKFNLLRAQIDACHEIDVKVPVYLTAGVNNVAAAAHPEWREMTADGRYAGWVCNNLEPGFKKMCFNTPYLDYLCALIEETTELFPDNDGIFLDIINQGPCCCPKCVADMLEQGYDPTDEADRVKFAATVLENYYRRTTAAARHTKADNRIFHNSGHISPAWLDRLQYFSHLELESLPTGGWGYDHFPQSAAFADRTGLEFLGMTGKFHSTWGEFGGLKHPNALRYECAAMIAQNARCSVGDQLHPSGQLDESTYRVIGEAYREVREKEPFCVGAERVADVAILPLEAFSRVTGNSGAKGADVGAGRLLLESHIPFAVISADMNFAPYKAILIPDAIPADETLRKRLDDYRRAGGRLILAGAACALGGLAVGPDTPTNPSFIRPVEALSPEFCTTPFVMYAPAKTLDPAAGKSLGAVYDAYFNRDVRHFCSHQHAPFKPEPSGVVAGVMSRNVLAFAHPVFALYRENGAVSLRQFVDRALHAFLDDTATIRTNLPSFARLTVNDQKAQNRRIVHLLYANLVSRGGGGERSFSHPIEVIEELLPLRRVACAVRVDSPVKTVTLEPQGALLPFAVKDGCCRFTVDEFTCHQMVAIQF